MSSSILNFKSKSRRQKHHVLRLVFFLVLPLVLLELWTSGSLFDHVSYTNSRNMDPQIKYFEVSDQWNFVALGSSETRWGIAPTEIAQELAKQGVTTTGFNLGLDGFNDSYYQSISPLLKLPERLPQLRVVLIGVNLVESARVLPQSFEAGFPCDGILQRTILTSAFAKDNDMTHLCRSSQWPEPLVARFEQLSAIVRYRQGLRTFLLGYADDDDLINPASNGLEQTEDGFFPHLPIKDNAEEAAKDLQRFLDEAAAEPDKFEPLAETIWPDMLAEGSFFDQWAGYFSEQGIVPVFFTLPTNPVMIDARNRRADYARNSQLMTDWANAQSAKTVFIDLGIKDDYNPTIDFADHRHLSEAGGLRFSRELGAKLAQEPTVIAALSRERRALSGDEQTVAHPTSQALPRVRK